MILDFIKAYMRIDFSDDDDQLNILIAMARQFILQSTGHTIVDDVELDKIALALVVSHFYENRESYVTNGAVPQAVPMTIRTLLLLLQASVVTV